MEKLTYAYIRKNFNIDKESIEIEDRNRLGEINVEFDDLLKVSELTSIFNNRLKDFPQDAYIQSFPYGYDGAETIEVFQKYKRFETETETIKRLIKQVTLERKQQKEYENALRVVENGISQK